MKRPEAALAKLSPPRLHDTVARTRLYRRLDEVRGYPVAWIAAPPGAGKTTLAASYLKARKLSALWYQVDTGDTDPASFFYYLGRAVGQIARKKQAPLPLLAPEYLADLPGFTRRFFRELFVRLPSTSLLVYDNVHEAVGSPTFCALLRDAFAEIPAGRRVLVLSRTGPPQELARLVANQTLIEIGWEELRLTLVEAAGIAGTRMESDEAVVSRLHADCDGWAAGLILMLERLKRVGPRVSHTGTESREAVFNYFAGEIFAVATPAMRELLLRTAFLPQVSVSIAEKLTGNADARKLLEYLYKRHLFTHRREGEEPSYQYHDLFRAFLRESAREAFSPEEFRSLAQTSAELLEESGNVDAAVSLYLEARDWAAATGLILRLAPEVAGQHGRGDTVRRWIDPLPRDHLKQQPWLLYWRAGAAAWAGEYDVALAGFADAHAAFVRNGDRAGQLLAVVGVLDGRYAMLDNLRQSARWLALLDTLLVDEPRLPSPEAAVFVYGTLVFFMCWVAPRHPALPLEWPPER